LGSPLRYDVVVIGAGMSGLAAAIRLAHFGKKVAVLERHDRVGGLNSYYSLNGYDLDVGLHAVTNFAPRGVSTSALSKIFRQLRIRPENFDLSPQKKSRIAFPGATLEFTNEFACLEEEVAEKFPSQKDRFRKLVETVRNADPYHPSAERRSAREAVSSAISEPLLAEMLLAPLMYYGNAMEDDMDYRQFVIMFQSIYLEGFARPRRGVREILDTLLSRLDESGGDLKLESGVRKILVENKKISGVELMDDTRIECDSALSSIGLLETIAICPESASRESKPAEGRLAFMESINILDSSPVELGMEHAITFFSNRENFSFRKPDEPVDVNDGVICVPDNFSYGEPLNSNMVRITNKADYAYWENINPMENLPRKRDWHSRSIEGAAAYMPDIRQKIKFLDIFTPRTVKRYTGHINGAVYGSPDKVWSGGTALPNLFLCGTDQGFLGIIGAMLSGISIANQYLLK